MAKKTSDQKPQIRNPKPDTPNLNNLLTPYSYYKKWYQLAKEIVLSFDQLESFNVFVFGGRAYDPYKKSGDLDIGIWSTKPIPLSLKYEILENLDESIVPFNVEIIDFYSVSRKFKDAALSKIEIWNQAKDSPISKMI